MIQDIITQSMLAYHEHVKDRMDKIPTGAILCVHDEVSSDPKSDDWKFTFKVESHVLAKDEVCDKKVRKQMYGPKPEGWPNG
jgi:hypothetical protein